VVIIFRKHDQVINVVLVFGSRIRGFAGCFDDFGGRTALGGGCGRARRGGIVVVVKQNFTPDFGRQLIQSKHGMDKVFGKIVSLFTGISVGVGHSQSVFQINLSLRQALPASAGFGRILLNLRLVRYWKRQETGLFREKFPTVGTAPAMEQGGSRRTADANALTPRIQMQLTSPRESGQSWASQGGGFVGHTASGYDPAADFTISNWTPLPRMLWRARISGRTGLV
jgi:hypothetical protein